MEYLRYEQDKIIKYDVIFDKDELNKIRYMIIKRCGKREHKSYDSDYPQENWLFHENYKQTIIGRTDYFEEMRRIYRVEYDLIHEPQLSKLIDNFIQKEDLSILDYLFGDRKLSKDINEKESKIGERRGLIAKLKKMLDSEIDYVEARDILDQIELIDKEDNNNLVKLEDQSNYLDLVKNAITLSKIDEIDYDLYHRVMGFTKRLKKQYKRNE